MLKYLNIRNYALIDSLELDFSSGFSVITGETGTGKSVLLGAISMMLGQRSDVKSIREGADRCVIEGHFDISSFDMRSLFEENDLDYDEKECIIRRELSSTGRSRAFINDTPVSISLMKEFGNRLIDIHSQHQNLLLGDKNFQLNVLDTLSDIAPTLSTYKVLFDEYVNVCKELSNLKKQLEKSRSDEEWLRFQYEEIESASLHDGEQEELEQELQELTHAEDIKTALYGAVNAIDGEEGGNLIQSLRDAANALSRISAHYQVAGELSDRLETNYIELKDCCDELRSRMERITFAPDRLEQVEQRLALIYSLVKKHKCTSVKELLVLANDYRERLEQITNGDDNICELQKHCDAIRKKLTKEATLLTKQRKEAALHLQKEMTDILITLGMPLIRFEVQFSFVDDFTALGCDVVTFLFSANSISPMQPLADVASGGEMARVMLALKSLVVAHANQPTLIFDEIDTGISGVLAERMGLLMQKMAASNRQVISITHLPQVAALGATHYKVYKEETPVGTRTNIILLNSDERVREIAQMMSGELLTDAAIDNAKLLLSQNRLK
ncbi:MAG: DNA repair protein RecN [Bacteroidaceae bacterium]|nr:DNA repair protein RecN [Bacteroidaceae bacterium]